MLKDKYYFDDLKNNCQTACIKFDLFNNTEIIYMKRKFESSKEISKNTIGTFILEILNEYEFIIETINSCENNITRATKKLVTNCRYLKKKFRNKRSNDYNKQKKELEDNYIDTCINHIFDIIYLDHLYQIYLKLLLCLNKF